MKDDKYIEMLLRNAEFSRRGNKNSLEYKLLQKELTITEKKLSAAEIIENTKLAFPGLIRL